MAQLLVRNLPDDVKARLKEKAKRHGRSLEEEASSALSTAAFAPDLERGLGARVAALFCKDGLEAGEVLAELPDPPLSAPPGLED